jgi:glycosyltransferase involved in cell wall biosynthesis
MRILLFSDAYPPEVRSSSHLMQDLAEGLAARGHAVTVVTSHPSHNVACEAGELPPVRDENGVKVVRVRVLPHHNVPFLLKGISQMTAPSRFARAAFSAVGAVDAVLLHSPPLPLHKAASKVARKYKARYVLNLHDFFPQNAVDLGILKNPFIIRSFEHLERRAYREADVIMTPSNEHKRFMSEKRGVPEGKIRVVPHWINIAPFEKARRTGRFRKEFRIPDEKIVILFAGVMGPSQGLERILELAARFRTEPSLHFLFVGEGSEKRKLMEQAKRLELSNVTFAPLVAKDEYPSLVKDADVGLVSLRSENTTPAVPAKLMGYMAGAIPTLAFVHNESDALRIVKDAQCGFAAWSGDFGAMDKAAWDMLAARKHFPEYGARALAYAKSHFSKEVCIPQVEQVLSGVW